MGRQANSDLLNIEAAGLSSDARGKLVADEHFQSERCLIVLLRRCNRISPHWPALPWNQAASAATCCGRQKMPPNLIPYHIYALPEIWIVAAQTVDRKDLYEVGLPLAELAEGQMRAMIRAR